MSVIAWILGGIGVAGAIAGVLYFIHTANANQVSLDERDAALRVEAERLAKEESAAEQARVDRTEELNAKVDSVRTVDDAVAVLRGELSRARGTPATDTVPSAEDAPGAKPAVAPHS